MKTSQLPKTLLALCLLLASLATSSAAVLVDSSFNSQGWFAVGSGATNDAVSGSSTFTVGNNSNRALVAIAFARGNDSDLLGQSSISLSYGGDDFTRIATSEVSDSNSSYRVRTVIYYLENPTTAADSTFSYDLGSANRGSGLNLLSIHGAASGIPSQVATAGDSGSSVTTTLDNVPAGALLVGGAVHEDNRYSFSADSGQTSYGSFLAGGTGDFDIEGTSSYKSISSAGEHSLGWTILNDSSNPQSEDYAATMIAVSAIPEPSAGLLLGLTGMILLLARRRGR